MRCVRSNAMERLNCVCASIIDRTRIDQAEDRDLPIEGGMKDHPIEQMAAAGFKLVEEVTFATKLARLGIKQREAKHDADE
jgi:hypothetical protein